MQMSSSGINVIKFKQKQDKGKFEEKMVRMQKHILVEFSRYIQNKITRFLCRHYDD
jgi:hypothetical protein